MKYKERFFDIQECSEREQLMYEVYYLYPSSGYPLMLLETLPFV